MSKRSQRDESDDTLDDTKQDRSRTNHATAVVNARPIHQGPVRLPRDDPLSDLLTNHLGEPGRIARDYVDDIIRNDEAYRALRRAHPLVQDRVHHITSLSTTKKRDLVDGRSLHSMVAEDLKSVTVWAEDPEGNRLIDVTINRTGESDYGPGLYRVKEFEDSKEAEVITGDVFALGDGPTGARGPTAVMLRNFETGRYGLFRLTERRPGLYRELTGSATGQLGAPRTSPAPEVTRWSSNTERVLVVTEHNLRDFVLRLSIHGNAQLEKTCLVGFGRGNGGRFTHIPRVPRRDEWDRLNPDWDLVFERADEDDDRAPLVLRLEPGKVAYGFMLANRPVVAFAQLPNEGGLVRDFLRQVAATPLEFQDVSDSNSL